MVKVNYVIASYNYYTNRTHEIPSPKDVLKCHIKKILSLKHDLTQITIMRAKPPKDYYEDFYNIYNPNDFNIKIIDCENYGYSAGQWLKCYELYRDKKEFDYYIFIEDDYVVNMDNFDDILLKIYKDKFKDNIGLLCSVVQGKDHSQNGDNGSLPLHFEGGVIISSESMEKVYQNKKFKGDPRKYLDMFNSKDCKCLDRIKNIYIGAYYQLTFSLLFTYSDILHKSYMENVSSITDNKIEFPYWRNRKKNPITFFNINDTEYVSKDKNKVKNSIVVPVQLCEEEYVNYYFT